MCAAASPRWWLPRSARRPTAAQLRHPRSFRLAEVLYRAASSFDTAARQQHAQLMAVVNEANELAHSQ